MCRLLDGSCILQGMCRSVKLSRRVVGLASVAATVVKRVCNSRGAPPMRVYKLQQLLVDALDAVHGQVQSCCLDNVRPQYKVRCSRGADSQFWSLRFSPAEVQLNHHQRTVTPVCVTYRYLVPSVKVPDFRHPFAMWPWVQSLFADEHEVALAGSKVAFVAKVGGRIN